MRTRSLAALLCGVILSLAFDPVGFAYAAPVAVAGCFALAHRMASVSWRQVAVAGFAFGLGFMGPLIWWMNAVSPGAYVALVIAQALFFALVWLGLREAARLRWWPV